MSKVYYSYQDVFLKPRYSEFHSRSEISTNIQFGHRKFKLPVLPANMACTMDDRMASWMSQSEYFYIMHRFNKNKSDAPNTDNRKFIERANNEGWKTISISIGVKPEDRILLQYCASKNLRIDYITIDIAHAHSVRMKEMIEFIKKLDFKTCYNGVGVRTSVPMCYPPFIIAGNVATPEAVVDLERWGADATKVGIAQGDACTTYGQTGFGAPMFTCIQECAKVATKPIIADGGIRTNGDFAKALVAGGTMVMAGSIFAACINSPADSVYEIEEYMAHAARIASEKRWRESLVSAGIMNYPEPIGMPDKKVVKKIYYGSASAKNKGSNTHVEGRVVELDCNGMTYQQKLFEIEESLQSSISYAGGSLKSVDWGIR